MMAWASYWAETTVPGVGDHYNVVDPKIGEVFLYVKSVDIDLGILEEVLFDGFMENGRPRPRVKYGRLQTRIRQVHFDIVHKKTGQVVYRVRK